MKHLQRITRAEQIHWIGKDSLFVRQFDKQRLVFMVLALLITGCDAQQKGTLHDISGHLPDLQFSLLSDTGQSVTNLSYRGYLVLLFFGFSHCPGECPAVLSRLAAVLRHIGDKAKDIRILFITLDPGRDTPSVLQRYLARFDTEHAIGLIGNEDQIEALVKRYRIAYRSDGSNSGDFAHSTAVYVFDPEGRARLLISPDDSDATITGGLLTLLDSPG